MKITLRPGDRITISHVNQPVEIVCENPYSGGAGGVTFTGGGGASYATPPQSNGTITLVVGAGGAVTSGSTGGTP